MIYLEIDCWCSIAPFRIGKESLDIGRTYQREHFLTYDRPLLHTWHSVEPMLPKGLMCRCTNTFFLQILL